MKKRLMILTVLALSLLLTACGSKVGGENSSHPYSWKEKSDGSVQLTIKNAPEDGYSWLLDGAESGLVEVERIDDGAGEKAVFSIKGQGVGGEIVRFSCRRDTAPFDASFQLKMILDTSEEGKLKVTSSEYTQSSSTGSVGEEGKATCMWYVGDDGFLRVYLDSNDDAYAWSAMDFDRSLISLGGPDYDETGCTYCLTGLEAGETDLLLYDLDQDYGFRLTLSIDESKNVAVEDGKAGIFAVAFNQIPGMDDVTALLGELTLPENVRILRCGTGNLDGSAEKTYAQLKIRLNDEEWELLATKRYSLQELIGLCGNTSAGTAQRQVSIDGFPAVLCGAGSAETLFWTDAQGRSFAFSALSDEGVGQEALLSTAENLCAALEGET